MGKGCKLKSNSDSYVSGIVILQLSSAATHAAGRVVSCYGIAETHRYAAVLEVPAPLRVVLLPVRSDVDSSAQGY